MQFEVRRRIASRLPAAEERMQTAAMPEGFDAHVLLQAPLSSHRKGFTEKQCT